MDVRLPNGQTIKNVPQGTSKADLVSKLQAKGHDVSWYKPDGGENGIPSSNSAGMDTLPDDRLAGRDSGAMGREAAQESSFPGASVIEPAAAIVSGALAEPVAGLAGIISGSDPQAPEHQVGQQAVEGVREALTYKPRTPAGKAGMETVAGVLEPIGSALKSAETFLGDETFESTRSPALAAAATVIPTAMLEVLGLASAKGIIKAGKNTKEASKNRALNRAIVESTPDIEQIKTASRAVYKELDDSGVSVKKEAFQRLANEVKQAAAKAGADMNVTPKAYAVLNRFDSEVKSPKTLTEIDTLRKVAQNAATSIDPADARIGAIMIDSIDSFLDSVSPSSLEKGAVKAADVGPKYKVARELWGRARRSELINDAFSKAKNQASGFENGIVVQFRSILNNKKKSRFFKPQEIEAMEKVVRGTTKENVAKLIGRLGFSEGHATNLIGGSIGIGAGAALGGPIGAVAVPVIGQVSRKLAQRLTRGNAEFADVVVRAGVDARKITSAYLLKTPKGARSASELSELLLRPDIALEKALVSKSPLMREAAEIAKGTRVLTALEIVGAAASPSVTKEIQE